MSRINEFGQPIGEPVDGWVPRDPPEEVALFGRYARLEPLGPEHAWGILTTMATHPELWTYRRDEPPTDLDDAYALISRSTHHSDDIAFAVIRRDTEAPRGLMSLMRTDRINGTIEVGAILYAPELQRSRMTTEALHLVASYVFDELHYRRLEWKCDSLNADSRRAALRLGFTEEGTFRNAMVYKNRNRDTTWFAITREDWPRVRTAHRRWLDPDNFDADGHQLEKLSEVFATLGE